MGLKERARDAQLFCIYPGTRGPPSWATWRPAVRSIAVLEACPRAACREPWTQLQRPRRPCWAIQLGGDRCRGDQDAGGTKPSPLSPGLQLRQQWS